MTMVVFGSIRHFGFTTIHKQRYIVVNVTNNSV